MISRQIRTFVFQRASGRCEYCRVHQDDFDFFTFHVEHIIPLQHGGSDRSENLCLSCRECNASNGPNLTGLHDGKIVPLFNPRRQNWKRHFSWRGARLVGLSLVGKATIQVLKMNDPARLIVRQSLIVEERFPPRV